MMRSEYKNREYTVIPYDSRWRSEFEELAGKIRRIFGDDALDIEHIGSTSVPGMCGKPTIDVLVLVNAIERADVHTTAMQDEGFEYAGQFVMDDSRLFRVMRGRTLLANVHVFPKNHPHVQEMLLLRDYLRTHEAEVLAYSRVKEDLYKRYPRDYAGYRKEKDAYMSALKMRAGTNEK